MPTRAFSSWIAKLKTDVIQSEYGYEEGEFTVYPDHWKPLFREGLTPQQAFRRALDDFAEARRQEEADRKANWERIQKEDAAAVARERAALTPGGTHADAK